MSSETVHQICQLIIICVCGACVVTLMLGAVVELIRKTRNRR